MHRAAHDTWLYSTDILDTLMGFLDRFKKKNEPQNTEPQQQKESGQPQTGKRIKRYTSEGKPIYE